VLKMEQKKLKGRHKAAAFFFWFGRGPSAAWEIGWHVPAWPTTRQAAVKLVCQSH